MYLVGTVITFARITRVSACCPCDGHGSDPQDTCHGGWDHRPLLDGARTVGVPCTATALDTPEATWASLPYPETPDERWGS